MEEGEAAAIYFSRGSTAKKAGDEKTHDLYKHIREEEEHHRDEFTKRYGELRKPQYSTTVEQIKFQSGYDWTPYESGEIAGMAMDTIPEALEKLQFVNTAASEAHHIAL